MKNLDITACVGTDCPFRHYCKCYLAHKEYEKQGTDGKIVQYFNDVPYDLESNSCAFFWRKR